MNLCKRSVKSGFVHPARLYIYFGMQYKKDLIQPKSASRVRRRSFRGREWRRSRNILNFLCKNFDFFNKYITYTLLELKSWYNSFIKNYAGVTQKSDLLKFWKQDINELALRRDNWKYVPEPRTVFGLAISTSWFSSDDCWESRLLRQQCMRMIYRIAALKDKAQIKAMISTINITTVFALKSLELVYGHHGQLWASPSHFAAAPGGGATLPAAGIGGVKWVLNSAISAASPKKYTDFSFIFLLEK